MKGQHYTPLRRLADRRGPEVHGPRGAMKHILLVDDDSGVMGVLVGALRDYRLTVARDGAEALSVIGRAEPLDLVITDYLMPAMTGDELIGRLRADRPGLRALVITGHG